MKNFDPGCQYPMILDWTRPTFPLHSNAKAFVWHGRRCGVRAVVVTGRKADRHLFGRQSPDEERQGSRRTGDWKPQQCRDGNSADWLYLGGCAAFDCGIPVKNHAATRSASFL